MQSKIAIGWFGWFDWLEMSELQSRNKDIINKLYF